VFKYKNDINKPDFHEALKTCDIYGIQPKIREFDLFPKDYDFVITGEFGWPVVPLDIQEATKMLINDMECNKSQYLSKYIKEYKTDQFTIKYDDLAWKGTGNMMVDQILSAYQNSFDKMGVL
jgi:hypothetical protein